ncbi:MAG TPA: ATP-binding protein [Bacteroidota bacterium]
MKGSARRKDGIEKCEMTCKSNPKEIAKVEKFLARVNKKAHLDDGTTYRLLVATTEAVNNAILHGNKSDPRKLVRISCSLEHHILTMTVQDSGKGFDPSGLANPLAEENLLKESGRGIFLIRSLIDEVNFRIRKNGTSVIMKMDLSKLE